MENVFVLMHIVFDDIKVLGVYTTKDKLAEAKSEYAKVNGDRNAYTTLVVIERQVDDMELARQDYC